ncbi:MAG TPA: hypothetical protein VGO58_16025 [Chitinophagaceae bacterium]|jgi:hypothetical protein|nr:hypothetical protein [Chitinophagaceae bacterium]
MRTILFAAVMLFLASCNGGDKKDPNQAMDDTARMRNPPVKTVLPVEPARIDDTDISFLPSAIAIKGKVKEAWKWTDELGENILVTSVVGPYDDREKNKYGEEGQTVELYAVHYAKKMGDFRAITTLADKEKSCPFDITAAFIPGSTTITDLDKDGIAEIKVQYLLACRSDVSPATMKLIISEDGTKYGLTGSSWIRYSPEFKFNVTEKGVNLENLPELKDETETMLRSFGRYENEKQFASAPPEFIVYARKEWLKYVMEKMGE